MMPAKVMGIEMMPKSKEADTVGGGINVTAPGHMGRLI